MKAPTDMTTKTRPTIASLQADVAALTERARDAETKAYRLERAGREQITASNEAANAAQERENALRDRILGLTTENARMRGYLDRIEDDTPVRPDSRYSRQNENRQRFTGKGDHFATAGVAMPHGPRPWHHR